MDEGPLCVLFGLVTAASGAAAGQLQPERGDAARTRWNRARLEHKVQERHSRVSTADADDWDCSDSHNWWFLCSFKQFFAFLPIADTSCTASRVCCRVRLP